MNSQPTPLEPGQVDNGPCRICRGAARHHATKLCDRCWELESRIHADRGLAVAIVGALISPARLERERVAIQHRTTGAYLTTDNTMTPHLREADTFANREGARVIYESLEDFQTAWDIVPAVGLDWPDEFPGAWMHWPRDLQTVAARLLMQRHISEFGSSDLVKHIVTHHSPQHPVPFGARAEKFWPEFLRIARRRDPAPVPASPTVESPAA